MRWNRTGLLGGLLLLGASCGASWADDLADSCAVPPDLALVNYPADHVYARLKARDPLRILVVGSTSSMGSSSWASKGLATAFKAYPRLLEEALAERMPRIRAIVIDKTAARQTAPMVAAQLDGLLAQNKPDLVIWEAGTTDAVQRLDVTVFGDALSDGLRRLRDHGVDVFLVDIQYSPQTDSLYDFRPYLDYLLEVAEAQDANILRRYAVMRHYTEEGRFDPGAPGTAEQFRSASFVHGCLAKQLATMILTAAQQQP
ncbi:hypothetical protein [Telmatospirillum sp.]|uniref:hypothetical protein n=1 Tax=Telmatospirillum sp. TaxID=2079197 RepID=UPI002845FEEA|nr:hypothetical protein [Telmatospirillum sp.]MDR3439655.1 hypothetical protein [Telmatospirillum sp.]